MFLEVAGAEFNVNIADDIPVCGVSTIPVYTRYKASRTWVYEALDN